MGQHPPSGHKLRGQQKKRKETESEEASESTEHVDLGLDDELPKKTPKKDRRFALKEPDSKLLSFTLCRSVSRACYVVSVFHEKRYGKTMRDVLNTSNSTGPASAPSKRIVKEHKKKDEGKSETPKKQKDNKERKDEKKKQKKTDKKLKEKK